MCKLKLVFTFILYSHRSGARWQTVRLFLTSSCTSGSSISLKKCELHGCREQGFSTGARRLHGSYQYWHAKYFLLTWLWTEPITQSSIVWVLPPSPSTFQWYWVVWAYKIKQKNVGLVWEWMKRAQYWHSLWSGSLAGAVSLTADLLRVSVKVCHGVYEPHSCECGSALRI